MSWLVTIPLLKEQVKPVKKTKGMRPSECFLGARIGSIGSIFMGMYCVPGSALSSEDTEMKKEDQVPALLELKFQGSVISTVLRDLAQLTAHTLRVNSKI